MPGFDRTGPRGMGPRTGRGRGFCYPAPTTEKDSSAQESTEQSTEQPLYGLGRGGLPRGCGRGFGGGRGRCWR
ncbi:MAG TPA: DUF5320 domain-containing protein [Methanomicrobiales archaeon]|nr:DUF5320 domain-containing protein [Methanomicrobiales archaeon]